MKRARDSKRSLGELMADYKFQPALTSVLDAIGNRPFDQSLINEMVLWKLDRYAPIEEDLLVQLNQITQMHQGDHRRAQDLLSRLLEQPGVDLAMASTLLRFRNPQVFQIIDRHAYRAVYGARYPLFPASSKAKKIETYFNYIDELIDLAREKQVDFSVIDRLLYVFDKQENGKL
jgi:hypothetical protein